MVSKVTFNTSEHGVIEIEYAHDAMKGQAYFRKHDFVSEFDSTCIFRDPWDRRFDLFLPIRKGEKALLDVWMPRQAGSAAVQILDTVPA